MRFSRLPGDGVHCEQSLAHSALFFIGFVFFFVYNVSEIYHARLRDVVGFFNICFTRELGKDHVNYG